MNIEQGYVYITNGTVDTVAGTVSDTDSANNIGTAKCLLVNVEDDIVNETKQLPMPSSPNNFDSSDSKTYIIYLKRVKGALKFDVIIKSDDSINTWLYYKKILKYLAGKGNHPDDSNKFYGGIVNVVWKLPEGYQNEVGIISKIMFKEQSDIMWKNVTDYTQQIPNKIKATIQIMVGELR